ncbi:hypothetical protein [Candidatus Marimicrobium litorale]|uniref:hypothetical protein n=1 Tax=Candidatus Marimicrobium litorale TaxID=2518991 RepID=UPI0024319DBB|nr:hypothetical protein [Candidatus Marimicrobium litorale]
MTQTLVNKIRPEKFQVSWERAWSFYPFRVHAQGIAANGQTRSQQWEVHAESGSGSIALLPLVLKHVYLSDIEVENVDYRQRPRLKAERDYSKQIAYFPPITGRDIVPVDTQPLKKSAPGKFTSPVSLSLNEAKADDSRRVARRTARRTSRRN